MLDHGPVLIYQNLPPHPIYEKGSYHNSLVVPDTHRGRVKTKYCYEIYAYLKASWPILVVLFLEEENCEV